MQENDFEKQVHQKMVALRLQPSEAVWEQVAMRIHRKEKRRRWIIWFPLLLAGIALGGYFAINARHTVSKDIDTTVKNTSAKQPQQKDRAKLSNKVSITDRDRDSAISLKTLEEGITKNDEAGIAPANSNSFLGKIRSGNEDLNNKQRKQRHDAFSEQQSLATTAAISLRKKTGDQNSITSSLERPIGNSKEYQSLQGEFRKEILVVAANAAAVPIDDEGNNHLIKTSPVKPTVLNRDPIQVSLGKILENTPVKITARSYSQRSGLTWGFSLQAGRAAINNSPIGTLFNGARNDQLASGLNQFVNGAPSANQVYTEPYPTSASAGFSAGAFLRKPLSERFALSLGINYAQYNTSTRVGTRVDSVFRSAIAGSQATAERYFRIGSTGSYTNRYHFIELPLMLQTTLTAKWKRPLYYDMGISFSRLVASNALHFDKTKGTYYQDNSLLNKTQFNIVTGLPVTLAKRNHVALQAGPVFVFGSSNIVSNKSLPEKHFLFLGLKLNMAFNK